MAALQSVKGEDITSETPSLSYKSRIESYPCRIRVGLDSYCRQPTSLCVFSNDHLGGNVAGAVA